MLELIIFLHFSLTIENYVEIYIIYVLYLIVLLINNRKMNCIIGLKYEVYEFMI